MDRTSINKALCKVEGGVAVVGRLASAVHADAAAASPTFVVGTGRCGSTLFSRVLESHASLLVYPTEANNLFFPHSYPYSRATLALPPIMQDPASFTQISLDAWPQNQARKLRDVFAGFRLLNPRGRLLLVKSAMISFMMPRLLEIYPDARFIHLYRDGRSVVASILKKEWLKYENLTTQDEFMAWAANYWSQCLLEIDRVEQAFGLKARGQFFELSYEDFCEQPRELSASLADFLQTGPDGFDFDFSTIKSTNHKARALSDAHMDIISELIRPGMELKSYL